MRGAARIGGRAFRPTPSSTPRDEFNPLEALDLVGDLPVAPTLEPINDEWSWSLGAEPADPRDCSRYPASPYCGELPASTIPFGYEPEIKTNGCETCLYVYPVILWLKVTPQVICRRDPNCELPGPVDIPEASYPLPNVPQFPLQTASPWVDPSCVNERNRILVGVNNWNRQMFINAANRTIETGGRVGTYKITRSWEISSETSPFAYYGVTIAPFPGLELFSKYIFREATVTYPATETDPAYTLDGYRPDLEFITSVKLPPCPDATNPPPKPPPPVPPLKDGIPPKNDVPQNRRRRGKDMCCNDCADSKDNTDKLLKELKEIKKVLGTGKLEKALNAAVGIGDDSITAIVNLIAKRLGTSAYPIEVPESLLQGLGDGTKKMESNAEFLHWLTYQIDSLVGQFPVDIDVKDIDPLKEGEQKKTIQIPNIAEAIAEMYALTLKSSVNQEVELNMLLRLAAEIIATKNASVVAQDYARANATFLGYKANYKPRELQYNFDFTGASLDPRSKEPIVLEKLLKTVTGYVQGWEIADKETVVGFLQKLMFSAGIIKAVFFRGKGQQKELNREISAMTADETAQEEKFEAFIKEINDPNSRFNKNAQDKPEIKDETPPDSNSKGAK